MTASSQLGWRWAAAAAALGALAVALGAFGAHALEDAVSPDRLVTWRTAAHYHLVHALAGVAAGVFASVSTSRTALWASRLFVAGIVLFSGSLYALVLLDLGVLGAVAPLGGVAFIAGWCSLAAALWHRGRGA